MDSAALQSKIKRNGHIRLQWKCPFEPVCTDHFDTKAAFKAHLRRVHDSLPYRCLLSDCTASFGSTAELGAHINSTHSTLPRFQCPKCPKSYSAYPQLRDHHSDYHQPGLLQCLYPHCNQAFTIPAQVYTHQRNHPQVTCPHCGKIIKPHSLWAHLQIHSTEKPYKCTTCKRVFATKGTLEAHTRIHSGAKPYTCSVCSKAFTQRSTKNKHEETHGEATLQCDYCDQKFSGQYTLRQHFRLYHREKWTLEREGQKKEQESYLLFANLRLLAEVAAALPKLPV